MGLVKSSVCPMIPGSNKFQGRAVRMPVQQVDLGDRKLRADVRNQTRRNDQVADRCGLNEANPGRVSDPCSDRSSNGAKDRNWIAEIAIQSTLEFRGSGHLLL